MVENDAAVVEEAIYSSAKNRCQSKLYSINSKVEVVDEPVPALEQSNLQQHKAAVEVVSNQNANLMPQDILRLTPQQLDGEWTVEKWEYWFRNSTLTPAVQELAQQGAYDGSN